MGVLKWIGYTVATIIALAVVAGGAFLVAVVATIAGVFGFLAVATAFVGLLFEEFLQRFRKPGNR